MKISIVIPAYNEEKLIGKTLEAINNLEKKKDWIVEVLVVDASSTDKTVEVAGSYGARIKNEPHRGIGFARQHGLEHALGDIVLFTDADTIVPKDWLLQHVKVLEKEGVVCTFGGYRYSDGTFPLFHIFNYIQPIIVYLAYKLINYPVASGQNIACWRKKALDMGGFRELNVMEDSDFTIRMRKMGKVVYLPSVLIYSSGRRGKEGLKFYFRMLRSYIDYFILKKQDLDRFPDYR